MTQKSESKHIRVKIPNECHLWINKAIARDDLRTSLALEKTYEDDSHLIRTLLKCKQCGHMFFHEFYEIVDWEHGNDAQYSSWIPVDDVESADSLNRLTPMGLSRYAALRVDYPSSADKPTAPYWNVREAQG